jgi:hypothetical protein
MRHLFFLLTLLAFANSCTLKVENYGDWVQKIQPVNTTELIANYAAELRNDRHLQIEDSYIIHGNYIEKFHLEFITQDLYEVKDARALLVDLVEGFCDRVNQNDAIKTQLARIPLTFEDVEIVIFPENYYARYCDERYIGLILLKDCIAYYYGADLRENRKDFWHKRIEYYAQSRDFLRYQREGDANYFLSLPKRPPPPLYEEQYVPDGPTTVPYDTVPIAQPHVGS